MKILQYKSNLKTLMLGGINRNKVQKNVRVICKKKNIDWQH